MKNVSILLVGGELDGQTYTAREDEKILRIHFSEKKDVVTDSKVNRAITELPDGHFYIYEQEAEGSNRFVYTKTE
jgi:hypothetical protein